MRSNIGFRVLIPIIFLFSVHVLASKDRGGGDAIVCYDKDLKISSVTLYDYFEAEKTRGTKAELGGQDLTVEQKVILALDRLSPLDPKSHDRYLRRAQDFLAQTIFVENAQLSEIDDTSSVILPLGDCKRIQFAAQYKRSDLFQKRYLVNKTLWKIADKDTQAVLILHEIIYQDAMELGLKNSDGVRFFNSLLSSSLFQNISPLQYLIFLAQNDFLSCQIEYKDLQTGQAYIRRNGKFVLHNSPTIHDVFASLGQIYFSLGKCLSDNQYSVRINNLTYSLLENLAVYKNERVYTGNLLKPAHIIVGENEFDIDGIGYYENGQPRELHLYKDIKLGERASNSKIKVSSQYIEFNASYIRFNENGRISKIFGDTQGYSQLNQRSLSDLEYFEVKIVIQNQSLTAVLPGGSASEPLEFYDNGLLKTAIVFIDTNQKLQFLTSTGMKIRLEGKRCYTLNLDIHGNIIQSSPYECNRFMFHRL